MATISEVQQRNLTHAQRINEEAMSNSESQYAGKFVGLANGQIVAVADDLDDVVRQLRASEPDTSQCYCFQAGVDYEQVQEIWNLD